MDDKMAKKLTKYFERVNKMVEYFEKRDLTLITYYTVPDALVFVFEFDSTDGSYEYTVKVGLYGDFVYVTDEVFDQWLEETYDNLMEKKRWAQNGKGE